MGQQGEAILFLLPAEIGYLELLAKTGCRIAEMDLDGVMRALPAVPNQSAVRSLARAAVGQSHRMSHRLRYLCQQPPEKELLFMRLEC